MNKRILLLCLVIVCVGAVIAVYLSTIGSHNDKARTADEHPAEHPTGYPDRANEMSDGSIAEGSPAEFSPEEMVSPNAATGRVEIVLLTQEGRDVPTATFQLFSDQSDNTIDEEAEVDAHVFREAHGGRVVFQDLPAGLYRYRCTTHAIEPDPLHENASESFSTVTEEEDRRIITIPPFETRRVSSTSGVFEVRAGETLVFHPRLLGTAGVRGTLMLMGPVANQKVRLQLLDPLSDSRGRYVIDAPRGSILTVFTDENGFFEQRGLEPGHYALMSTIRVAGESEINVWPLRHDFAAQEGIVDLGVIRPRDGGETRIQIETPDCEADATVIFAELTPTDTAPLGGVVRVRAPTCVRLHSLVDGAEYSLEVTAAGFHGKKTRFVAPADVVITLEPIDR